MNRLKWLSLLMIITILVVTGFQGYWMKQNYTRELRSLEIKTNFAFRETLFKLQARALKLEKFTTDSTSDFRFELKRDLTGPANIRIASPEVEMVTIMNDLNRRVRDSLIFSEKQTQSMIISLNQADMILKNDSSKAIRVKAGAHPGNRIVQFLYGVDSLKDSVRIIEIDSALRAAFDKEKIDVPFSISKTNASGKERIPEEPGLRNKITLGFADPVTFELRLGNTFPYIMKRLGSQILFSVFLVGVTILSFLLLYKNLLRQKMLAEIKNEFISNITHELKTPIATVGVAIEALRNFNAINDPERTKEYLDISQNELHRLSLLVDKVLKLSMFEKKEIELKPEPVDMRNLVDEVVASMKLQIDKRQAAVSVSASGDTGLQGDKLHLLSVVFNLLDNALKYGNGNIEVKFEIEGDDTELKLSVSDNGIGIAPEYKDKVFEKFFRVPAGDTHNTKGYGLGLSYAAHVIQKHNGKILVESQPGSGTKFIITIPKQEL